MSEETVVLNIGVSALPQIAYLLETVGLRVEHVAEHVYHVTRRPDPPDKFELVKILEERKRDADARVSHAGV